ncbi:HTH domain-containing protein [Paenibacillus doosanensis]|uniref:TrmB family transcriptional regulator n=1 Tax=Paenibacillus doosanensis TaxID=1229154 RepID=UPI0021803598|nr:helix-turn-helix domain-containing protein [Paenibacillus doosanensis]MCS7459636.1 HTH domain-containing protein [Paenibacillus doosanensis]
MEGILQQHLKHLGFTELEAKCLFVLSDSGTLTGYEIAKRLGVSRSNVYAALQKLAEQGVVLASKGEPTHYHCVPIDEIGNKIEADLQASIRYVKAHMPKQETERTEYFSLEGDAKVLERLRCELKLVKREALCDLWSEEAELLRGELQYAHDQGVRILVSAVGGADLPEGMLSFPHEREEAWQERSGRKFALLLDRKLAIVGTRGGGQPAKAMLTEHPAMVELLLNNFFHDVVMHELQRDMGDELARRYGQGFSKIVRKYTQD